MTTTAYLDLFLRSVTEPALLQTLLSFILLHQHEGVHILDTLVSRINTPFQVRITPPPANAARLRGNKRRIKMSPEALLHHESISTKAGGMIDCCHGDAVLVP